MDDSLLHAGWWFLLAFSWVISLLISGPMPFPFLARALVCAAAFAVPSVVAVKATSFKGRKAAGTQQQLGPTGTDCIGHASPLGRCCLEQLDETCDTATDECIEQELQQQACSAPHQPNGLASSISLQDWQVSMAQEQLSPKNSHKDVLGLLSDLPDKNPDSIPAFAATPTDGLLFRAVLHSTPFGHRILSEDSELSAAAAATSSEEQDVEPTTPSLYICTSTRHIGLRKSTSKLSSAVGSLLSGGGLDNSPIPLPSPAESPLARRVTNERDEHGFPLCPGLVELLRQHSSTDDSSSWDGSDTDVPAQAPWSGLQLRSISQQLEDSHNGDRPKNSSPPWLPLVMTLRHVSVNTASSYTSSSNSKHGYRLSGAGADATAVADMQWEEGNKFSVAQLIALHSAASTDGGLSSWHDQCTAKPVGS